MQGATQMQKVTTGLVNDSMIEIISGLNEGDVVQLPASSSSSNFNRGMGGPMMGGGQVRRN
jgi:hypothetical protein